MSAISGRTAIQYSSNVEAPQALSLAGVELPASVEKLTSAAVRRLGWHGTALAPMMVFGRSVILVAKLRTDVHAERVALGYEPELDRTTVATWAWPEFENSAPSQAVEIVGALGVSRHWRTSLAAVAPFMRYCDTGIVLPWSVAMTNDYLVKCLPRAVRFGVNVLTADPDGETNLDQIGAQEPVFAQDDAIGRWINELVYSKLVA